MTNGDTDHSAYDYNPSKPAAWSFLGIFTLLFLVHAFQALKLRSLWAWPLILGLFLEVLGFSMRYVSIITTIHSAKDVGPLVISQISIIVAPACIAAYLYMAVGRMMSFLGAEHSPVSHNILTRIFVIADYVSISTQGNAAGLLSSESLMTIRVGAYIITVALAFQVVLMMYFLYITIVFDTRSHRVLREKRKSIQPLFYCIYITTMLILLRSIYRLIEYATIKYTTTGPSGYTVNTEWILFAFDSGPVAVSCMILATIYPAQYLPHRKGLRIDGTYEEQKPSTRVWGFLWKRKQYRTIDNSKSATNQSFGIETGSQSVPLEDRMLDSYR
ncbi:RTA1 like protein-domain-containing protein [Auriculariales sp. MPI-PUGE-AT-0066]|nr:RTA1 like protein-domain-containing protein [Auriculariales sp. MPI-PUGE-AT-0066]